MAELILTDQEKRDASYLDWSDEALGRAVKKAALIFGEDDQGKAALKHTAACVFLIAESIKCGATETTIELEGAHQGDKQLGNWKVTLERIEPAVGAMIDIREVQPGDFVKTDSGMHEIESVYGVQLDDDFGIRLAKPSDGGFGVVTKRGERVTMYEALSYHKSNDRDSD